ncbi:UNVERIFIED_CONTAM: hypothetical protein Slati_2202700 [Sesamum latifolium]|uniref:Uncharacterized protein n=1 Tax=Sesamum latifolium TaxID=2727402 RepID=A0AAW2WTP1_9LAMI
MWEKLLKLGQPLNMPWLILGDFNGVKSPLEKQLGATPNWYELKDFADCFLSLGLHDAPTTVYSYTWYSNSDSNPIWYKLHLVLLDNEWFEAGLHCNAHFNLPGCLFDHSLGIVSILNLPTPKPKPFRFFNMWADHSDFIATIENGWTLNVDGTPQFNLCRKLKGSLGDLKKKAVFFAEAERQFYYQKAKIHFLKMGDRNTKFFHDMVKRNTSRSSILAAFKSTEVQILLVDNDVFEWGPKLSLEHALELYRAVTPLEVKQAIFQIRDNKAPRPDEYSICFFKRAWNIVGDQVCTAVMNFFRSGRMLRQLNHAIIALVPKSEHSPPQLQTTSPFLAAM